MAVTTMIYDLFNYFAAKCIVMQENRALSSYRQQLHDRILDTAIQLFAYYFSA